jgi:hypothetical protein
MRWSTVSRWSLTLWAIAACSSRVPTDQAGNDAGPTTTSGTGGASTTGGTAGTSIAGGNAGVGGTSSTGGADTADASGTGGTTTGTSGVGGTGGTTTGSGGGSGTGGNTTGSGGGGGSTTGMDGAGGTGGTTTGAGGAGTGGGGGRAGTGGTGGGTAGAGGSNFDGGADECVVDQDCPPPPCPTLPCPETLCAMGNDGFHHCVTRVHPALTSCSPTGPSCCMDDNECGAPRGHCIPWTYNFCGGPPGFGNSCKVDACTSDMDCTAQPNGFCTADYPRGCVYGPCRTKSNCNQRAGGLCVMDRVYSCPRDVVFCRYADDPCQSDADCKPDGGQSQMCVPRDDLQGMMCVIRPPPPP